MFSLGLFTSAAYWPGIFSPAMVPKWIALSCLAPGLLLWRDQPLRLTKAHLFGSVLILWAACSVLWSIAPLDSLNGLWLTAILPAICFCLGSQTPSLRPLFIGLGCGMAVSSAVAIGQGAGWFVLPEVAGPSGLFINRNFMAEAAVLVLVWLIAERVWWLAVLVMPAVALVEARGALLALGACLAVLLWKTRSPVIGGLLAATVALFCYATFDRGTATMVERADIWTEASQGIVASPAGLIFGHGIGTFGSVLHPEHADGVAQHAHNDILELVWDLGLVGLGLGALFVRQLFGPLNSARLVLVAVAVEALFAFPLQLPVTLAVAALAAGYAVRDRAMVWGFARAGRDFSFPGIAANQLRQVHVAIDAGGAGYAAGPAVSSVRLHTLDSREPRWHATI